MDVPGVGELVGSGRTSDVYAYGSDSVIKIPHFTVPNDWSAFEAALTNAVRSAGVPAPEVRDLIEIDGRTAVVFERIRGLSMWQQIVDAPEDARRLACELSSIHRSLLSVGVPTGVPDLIDRMGRKLASAPQLSPAEREEAQAIAVDLPHGAALLHGDLHPGNVLMGPKGAVVIDWFDAAIGHPIADIVRSSILLQPHGDIGPPHLPNPTPGLLQQLHDTYLGEFSAEIERERSDLARWRAVVGAGRLTEGAEHDESGLLALWNDRNASAGEASTRMTEF